MKTFAGKVMVVFVVLIGVLAASQSFAADKIADVDITYWVKDALRQDVRVDAPEISVGTRKGIVTLSGSVSNLAAKKYADLETKKIKGVLGVINKIEVIPGYCLDTDIRNAVRRRIINSAVIESEGITVTSVNGKVTLSGTVATYAEKKEAELLASEVNGVKEVENNIFMEKWQTRRSDQEIKNDVVAALERDVYLTGLPITVSVKDGIITLTGSVGSAYEKDRADSDIRFISHVKDVKNKLKVEWWENNGFRKKKIWPSDNALKKVVQAELDQDSRVDASDITVKVSFGYVILNGSVFNHYQKRIAEQDARDVVGVGWVANNLFARVDKREDWVISDDVSFNLATDYILKDLDIETKVKDGVVTLSGSVVTWYEKTHAEDVASRVRAVKKVINQITTHWVEGKTDAELARTINSRLKWDWTTYWMRKNIKVTVRNGVVTLTGDVDTWSQRREAGLIALQTEGIWKMDNRLTVDGYDYPWDEWHYKGPYIYDPYDYSYYYYDYYPY